MIRNTNVRATVDATMTSDDYSTQPPPSTGTTVPPSPFPHMHPVTGSDVAGVTGLGLAIVMLGACIVLLVGRNRRTR